jgi:ABC-type antimicrobial peptide transport system permease subunit
MTQFAMPTGMLFVRVAGNASQFTELVRRRLQQEMPGASYVTAQPFRDVIDPAMRTWRVGAQLFVAFGALALIIAAVGLHSVIAYGVAQRRRELGVRIALGASPANLMRLVVLGGLRLMLAGIAIGTAVALAAGRGIAGLLFQETPNDPLVYGLVAGVLLLVSIIATTLPALAAARVDPNLSLREE